MANLFNLEVDLIFLDTTTTYFEVTAEDMDLEPEEPEGLPIKGLRKRSPHLKDSRPDLPQVVIAFAVTRTGIPVRCWVWPGSTSDQTVGGHYIMGEKLRHGRNASPVDALSKRGKYSTRENGLGIKDIVLGYKQLFEIERVFKDMKHFIDILPVRHRLAERIHAHVLLCWLGMLLIRLIEQETGKTWFQLK